MLFYSSLSVRIIPESLHGLVFLWLKNIFRSQATFEQVKSVSFSLIILTCRGNMTLHRSMLHQLTVFESHSYISIYKKYIGGKIISFSFFSCVGHMPLGKRQRTFKKNLKVYILLICVRNNR